MVWTQHKDNCVGTRKQILSRHQIYQYLDFGFPASRIVTNKSSLSHPLYDILCYSI